jgi:hypothetical protein
MTFLRIGTVIAITNSNKTLSKKLKSITKTLELYRLVVLWTRPIYNDDLVFQKQKS